MADDAPPADGGPSAGVGPAADLSSTCRGSYEVNAGVDVVVERSAIAGLGTMAGRPVTAGTTMFEFAAAPREPADFGRLNHSCDPTLVFDGTVLVALRDIPPSGELTVDYSTAIDDPAFVLYCHCGSTRCRQAVEGTDWQIPQLQARYAGHWAAHIAARL